MIVMTEVQRKQWAEAVVKYEPPTHLYHNLAEAECHRRAEALFNAAAQLGVWTYLGFHLAIIHKRILEIRRLQGK